MTFSTAIAARPRLAAPIVPTDIDGFYFTREVSRLTGATLRQLQWWHERHIIEPVIKLHFRLYTTEDLQKVFLMMELRRKGMSLHQIRKALPQILKRNASYAVLFNNKLTFLDSPGEVIAFSSKQKGAVLVVQLNELGLGRRRQPDCSTGGHRKGAGVSQPTGGGGERCR